VDVVTGPASFHVRLTSEQTPRTICGYEIHGRTELGFNAVTTFVQRRAVTLRA
jgi:hypothetical protein